jgi:hypothetical protein
MRNVLIAINRFWKRKECCWQNILDQLALVSFVMPEAFENRASRSQDNN